MNSLEATARVVEVLEELNIPYMLVGAFSSNAYGFARNTNDADFVVKIESGDLRRMTDRLGEDFRLNRQMQLETITGSVRNVITFLPTMWDIELFRLSDDPHDTVRFRRRCRVLITEAGREAWIPTAEDVVIQKLRWQREQDLFDVKNVLAVRLHNLDWDYLHRWTELHGTQKLLSELLNELPDTDLLREE